ncbi:hypothetical protein OTB20_41220 [Streptomyces sp. H27-H1]|uniref:hypothetical protein n=1 Tax=Streptomyces sp. H27-H1 TaxID=2996461 RepID=UPI002270C727|nr:hypothetical protein [Streptomyces sp. H27-H1]MCY0932454.1 hypothetical protein [Streptomyces sp. H27-H1]
MSTPLSDDELWKAFIKAKREMHRRQADFYQKAHDRPGLLKAALTAGAGSWQQSAALDFLAALPDDAPALLGDLVGLSLSHGWALTARQAIDRIPHNHLVPLLEPLILERLDSADDDEYRRLAELLAHIEAWNLLGQLVHCALDTDDPATHEVAEDFTQSYGPMWLSKPNP